MMTIFYRDPEESAAQRDLLDIISGIAWGAIKDWQRLEGRPKTTAAAVREATDDWLRSMHGAEVAGDMEDVVDTGVAAVLAALDLADAKNYL